MPRFSKAALIDMVVRTVRNRGWAVTMLSGAKEHPSRLEIERDGKKKKLLVYIWNVSPGGKNRSSSEYRIQVTSGVRSFQQEDGFETVILGWSDAFGTFAAFDVHHRHAQLGGSPSLQISKTTIDQALEEGIGRQPKGDGEFAVAVRPDRLGDYLMNVASVHSGDTPARRDDDASLESGLSFLADEAETGRTYLFGSAAERRQRSVIEDRLDDLERQVQALRSEQPGRGHNHPPEMIEDEEIQIPEVVSAEGADIRQELTKASPDAKKIAGAASKLGRLSGFLDGVLKKIRTDLQDQIGSYVAGGIILAAGALGLPLISAIANFLTAVVQWFRILL